VEAYPAAVGRDRGIGGGAALRRYAQRTQNLDKTRSESREIICPTARGRKCRAGEKSSASSTKRTPQP
jgi:hypothetical protein